MVSSSTSDGYQYIPMVVNWVKRYLKHLRFGMLLPAVTQICRFQEGERKQLGKLGTVFAEVTLCFVRYCMFETLSLVTIRHLKWCKVCCDLN